jgi:uncharacterized membrane protein YkoI
METKKKIGIGVATVLAAGAGAAGIAAAGGSDDSEAPIAGSALKQAQDAALAETGEGTVTDTETGDEESFYEVEVTLNDGSEVDVQLNRDFEVVGSEAENEGEEESGADD